MKHMALPSFITTYSWPLCSSLCTSWPNRAGMPNMTLIMPENMEGFTATKVFRTYSPLLPSTVTVTSRGMYICMAPMLFWFWADWRSTSQRMDSGICSRWTWFWIFCISTKNRLIRAESPERSSWFLK